MSERDEINREIARGRAKIEVNLDRLSERLSFDNLVEEARRAAVGKTAQLALGAMRHVGGSLPRRGAADPGVDTARAGLMGGALGKDADPSVSDTARAALRRAADAGAELREEAGARIERTAGKLRVAAEDRAADLRDLTQALRAQIKEGTEGLSEEARLRVIAARASAIDAFELGQARLREGRQRAGALIEENPVLVGAAVIAVAVAIGVMWRRGGSSEDAAEAVSMADFDEADRIYQEELARAEGR